MLNEDTNKTSATTPSLPSYARSTTTSRRRQDLREHDSASTPPADRERSLPPPSPLRWELYRRYSASTKASRARDARPFRFLDLPSELRNLIYEFAMPSSTEPRRLDFFLGVAPMKKRRFPGLLFANKQLYFEAGSHYFGTLKFNITIDERLPNAFFCSYASLDPVARAFLAKNDNVTVYFVHRRSHCVKNLQEHEVDTSPVVSIERYTHTEDFTLVNTSDPLAEAKRDLAVFGAIEHWTFRSRCRKTPSPRPNRCLRTRHWDSARQLRAATLAHAGYEASKEMRWFYEGVYCVAATTAAVE